MRGRVRGRQPIRSSSLISSPSSREGEGDNSPESQAHTSGGLVLPV